MAQKEPTIHILPDGKSIKIRPGMSLFEALMHQGIFLRSDCGGKGKCGKCRVLKKTENGDFLEVNACTDTVEKDVSVKIPGTSLRPSHVMDKAKPIFPHTFAETFRDNTERDIPDYGAAVDLGTTTIAIYLCDISKKEVVSSIAVKNPQCVHGADVISRISAIAKKADGLHRLQQLVVKSIEWGLKTVSKALKGDPISITRMVVVGNPTMIHILGGIDPRPIGTAPYQPVFYTGKKFRSDQLGFEGEPFTVQTLPQTSGYIGGDILAASLSAGLGSRPDGTLLIDLGTNGELLLKNKSRVYAASCATGPAFEGAELSCGMQATPGAIDAVDINDRHEVVRVSVIGNTGQPDILPLGICGTGAINTIAQLFTKGIIKGNGAFASGDKLFSLVKGDFSGNQPPVFISQKDIRSVQLGKAALITGIELLLNEAGINTPELILVAGAFGNYLKKEDIIRLGMVPAICENRIEMIGNSAGAGAVMVLCDDSYLKKTIDEAEKVSAIDLAGKTEFQKRFIRNLEFPEQVSRGTQS